jgi:hypothetical protein
LHKKPKNRSTGVLAEGIKDKKSKKLPYGSRIQNEKQSQIVSQHENGKKITKDIEINSKKTQLRTSMMMLVYKRKKVGE